MFRSLAPAIAVSAFLLASFGGCRCGSRSSNRFPELRVDSTTLDFGAVLSGQPHTRPFRVRNLGTAPLSLTAFTVEAPFGLVEAAPLTVEAGTEVSLSVTFTPMQVGVRATGELIIESDDESERRVVVNLSGTGVEAVLKPEPEALAFGDVYVGELRALTLTLRNAGTAELVVEDAQWVLGTPASPVLSADLAALKRRIAAGASVATEVSFAPADVSALTGGIRLTLGGGAGETVVSLSGQGVRAVPQLCFQAEGSGVAQCTAADAPSGGQLSIDLAPTCDNIIYPSGHPSACTGVMAPRPGVRRGSFFVRNAGNTPVSYSLRFNRAFGNRNPCGLATPPAPDFGFSGAPSAPDGGVVYEWSTPSAELPGGAESAAVEVTYTATSRCIADSSEQAQVIYTRQGSQPSSSPLIFSLTGKSSLPLAVPSSWSFSGNVLPISESFYGVANRGPEPFDVTAVNLYELPTDGGAPILCDPSTPNYGVTDCARFGWAAGNDPADAVPITIPASPNPAMEARVPVGRLTFGAAGGPVSPDGGVDPTGKPELNRTYRLRAVVDTTDPYHPHVESDITATARP